MNYYFLILKARDFGDLFSIEQANQKITASQHQQ